MRKFKIIPVLLILILFTALLPAKADALDEPEITSRDAVLMDADSGEVLFAQNADATAYPASTTKIMTALLTVEAIERGDIKSDDVITAYNDCQYNMDDDSSNANPAIEPGEEMTASNLLYCVMLASANEACNILAEYISGSISAFVDLMNQRAAELGCAGTHFTNCNGLEDSSHYTTARDLAIIAQEAIKHDLFRTVCGTERYTVPATNLNSARNLTNTNLLLDSTSNYYYENAYGIKTGYFTNAGHCLVSAATCNNMNLICVVLGGEETDSVRTQYADTITLYNWARDNFSYQQVLSSTATLTQLPVSLGTSETVGLRAETAVSLLLPNDFDMSTLEMQYIFYSEQNGTTLKAPITAGDRLGEVTVLKDGGVCGTSYLVAASTVDMAKAQYLRNQVRQIFKQPIVRGLIIVVIVIFALYVILVCNYRIQRIRHRRSVRQTKRRHTESLARRKNTRSVLPEDKRGYPKKSTVQKEDDEFDIFEEIDRNNKTTVPKVKSEDDLSNTFKL
jgi:D-alanyl-D-alanine carboxypeptidase (penicillin-binding protein 5/6)